MRLRMIIALAQRSGLCVCGALALSGCATVTRGSSQNTTILTEPPGASCVFRRDGAVIGVVNPTPGTLSIEKGRKPIDVVCTKDGFASAGGIIGSHFEAMTLGNVLIGGVLGIAIDAASGASTEYEPRLTLALVPLVFATDTERDAFFAQRRSQFLEQAHKAKDRIAAECHGEDCGRALGRAGDEERSGLARIDAEYQSSRIGS